MSAPVTEAHRAITESVFELLDSVEMVGPSPAERAAQLIADSEATATAQANAQVESLLLSAKNAIPASEHPAEPTVENWAWQIRNLGDDRRLVYAERDQLRVEVERLREWQAGVIANERLHHAERKDALARAEKAESELATERARLDWLDAECSRGVNKLAHGSEERRSHVFTNGRMVKNKLGSGEVFDCDHYYGTDTRAAIDAAMKEENK